LEARKRRNREAHSMKIDVEKIAEKAHKEHKPVYTENDNTAYCTICNKTVDLKAGDEIPLCCGMVMQLID
jgi:hypothetical protein